MPTIAIAGAGPGLGLGIARRFGREGFQVALISRRPEALDGYIDQLKTAGITAAGAAQVAAAFADIKERFGAVDVLEVSPRDPRTLPSLPASACTPDNVLEQLKVRVLGPIACVQQVLPDMLSAGITTAGLRNYAHCLHKELAPKGIYAGFVCIGLQIKEGTKGDPDTLAAIYYDMFQKRDRAEEVYA
jgi:NAD(P)-dependent dehydrogenase (short-subunit alcohol dehydrogenase family)